MRQSQYHVDIHDWRSGIDILMSVVDPRMTPVWLAALGGAWALGSKPRVTEDRWVWVGSALAVFNVALFWVLIPYRSQYRFMYQALGLAAIPLARTFDRSRVVCGLGVVLLVAHMLTRGGWPINEMNPPWDLNPLVPNNLPSLIPTIPATGSRLREVLAEPARLLPVVASLLLGVTALATVVACCRAWERTSIGRLGQAFLAGSGMIVLVLALLYPWQSKPWQTFLTRPFPDYYRGWLALEARSGPDGAGGLRGHRPALLSDGGGAEERGALHQHRRAPRLAPARLPPRGECWLLQAGHMGYPSTRLGPHLIRIITPGSRTSAAPRRSSSWWSPGPTHRRDRTTSSAPRAFPLNGSGLDSSIRRCSSLVHGAAELDPLFRLYRVKPSRPGPR